MMKGLLVDRSIVEVIGSNGRFILFFFNDLVLRVF
jgi:hypothetical protein